MSTVVTRAINNRELQLIVFRLDDLLLGLEIDRIQEINRQLEITKVPRTPDYVRGVINLRGEVVTVIDPKSILGLPSSEISRSARNLVIQADGEMIGLLVDQVADILSVNSAEIAPSPANIRGVDGRFFTGVYTTDNEIVVLVDLDEMLSGSEA